MKKVLILSSVALLTSICVLNVSLLSKNNSNQTSGIVFNKALASGENDSPTPEIFTSIPTDDENDSNLILEICIGLPTDPDICVDMPTVPDICVDMPTFPDICVDFPTAE